MRPVSLPIGTFRIIPATNGNWWCTNWKPGASQRRDAFRASRMFRDGGIRDDGPPGLAAATSVPGEGLRPAATAGSAVAAAAVRPAAAPAADGPPAARTLAAAAGVRPAVPARSATAAARPLGAALLAGARSVPAPAASRPQAVAHSSVRRNRGGGRHCRRGCGVCAHRARLNEAADVRAAIPGVEDRTGGHTRQAHVRPGRHCPDGRGKLR